MLEKEREEAEAIAMSQSVNGSQNVNPSSDKTNRFELLVSTMRAFRKSSGHGDDSDTESLEEDEDDDTQSGEELNLFKTVADMRTKCSLENCSFIMTIYFGLSHAWRKNAFSW